MDGKPVPVQERNRYTGNPVPEVLLQRPAERGLVQREDNGSIRSHPFRHFDDPLVEWFRQYNMEVEQPRPVLVADAQQVTEPS